MKTRDSSRARRGIVAVALLIGLMAIIMVVGVLLRSALMRRVALAKAEQRTQAEFLAGSGLERAAARLASSKDYQGETWEINAGDLGRRDDALVTIRVEQVKGQAEKRLVVVQADYPRAAERRSRITRTISLNLNRSNPSEKGASK